MTDVVTGVLLIVGSAFLLLAGIGLLRMPDLYMRMSMTTKAAIVSLAFILLGGAVYFGDLAVTARVLAILVFAILTSPVGAQMIGRSAYFDGVPLWKGTQFDELRGKYDPESHSLAGVEGVAGERPEDAPPA